MWSVFNGPPCCMECELQYVNSSGFQAHHQSTRQEIQAVGHQSTPDSRSCFCETLITPSIIFVWQERKKERKRRRGEVIINGLFCSSSTWSEPRGPRLWAKQVRSVLQHLERSGTQLVAISSILILLPAHFLSLVWPHNSQLTLYHLH